MTENTVAGLGMPLLKEADRDSHIKKNKLTTSIDKVDAGIMSHLS